MKMSKKLIFFTLGSCLLAGILFFLFYPFAKFPAPTGQYDVGYTTYHWVDQSRQELNTQDPQHPYRELMVHVFYPTEKNDKAVPVAYDPDAAKSAMEYFAHCSKLPAWLFGSLKFIKTHGNPVRHLPKSTTSFPVVIFSHGANGPIVQSYTWMLEELASQGYVVVGIDHQRDKARDAQEKVQRLEVRTQDVSFAITKLEELIAQKDPFWSNVDLDRIGMLGHSFGGRTTVRATRKDARIKCGINLDGGIQDDDAANSFATPFMFVIAEKSFLWNKDHPQYRNAPDLDIISKLPGTKGTNIKMVTIKEVGHSVFLDVPLQLNTTLFGRLISRYALFGLEVPAGRASEILVNTIMPQIVNFFDEQLKD